MSEKVLSNISKIIGGFISANSLDRDFKVSYVGGEVGSFAIWLPLNEENCDYFSGLVGLYGAVVDGGEDIPLEKFAAFRKQNAFSSRCYRPRHTERAKTEKKGLFGKLFGKK